MSVLKDPKRIFLSAILMVASVALFAADKPGGDAAADESLQTVSLERDGVKVDFSIKSLETRKEERALQEGDFAEIEFSVTSSESGEPIRNSYPGVWIDLVETAKGDKDGTGMECKTRIGMYLQGMVGIRPMIDLNSYYILVLNREPSISVIDPVVGVSGITSLYASINLKRPGADWAKTPDENWMFVSLPRADEVAVVNLGTFKVDRYLPVGDYPTRVAMQPDARYVWVGNTGKKGEDGSVSVIDSRSFEVKSTIPVGKGHHEIAFSDNSRYAYVTNRDSGTVDIIDITELKKVAQVKTGESPLAMAYSKLSKSLYVGDGMSGEFKVIDAASFKVVSTIKTKPGAGPLRFSEDGRWGFNVNPSSNEVYVIDSAVNKVAHTIPVLDKPYKIGITSAFAYIRALETNKVTMVNLGELSKGGKPILNHFDAGAVAPSKSPDISIADAISPAALAAAVFVVSPGDNTVYYYMEGMNAPMGAFRNYGASPRAVNIADRAMKEVRPGVYASKIRLPSAGKYEVGYMNETPRFLHCFEMEARRNLKSVKDTNLYTVDYQTEARRIAAGQTVKLQFKINNAGSGKLMTSTDHVLVKYYRAPRFGMQEIVAEPLGDGMFQVNLKMKMAGAYYIQVAVPALNLGYNDTNILTMMAIDPKKFKAENEASATK